MDVILASKSPRRQELLKRIIKDFKVVVSDFNEDSVSFNGNPDEFVKELSKGKAIAVGKNTKDNSIIIAADTIVVLNEEVLGKPKNEKQAFEMLSLLSGNTHQVYSGVTILNTEDNSIYSEVVSTEVKFSVLTKEQIEFYIRSKEPMDKAGAYGIQGLGAVFVEEIRGCYYNVVGLPLNRLNKMLKKFNLGMGNSIV
jgi:septum formation protein